ncbi:NAD NADP transhydrogenase beta subunit [Ligilactobacillus ceti DSM 22408]|uniref:proton-translocating NAD(P)(+) transhydrogenase n=1 Tax=Ligilactobacillus ceti DSM 22408 TaxID=1122146 RepID=A0A0R2KIM3_9LACO|nr:NAD NADP transhydrogenase beta subunit [Ligilactobacillus ceti DSM 22408]
MNKLVTNLIQAPKASHVATSVEENNHINVLRNAKKVIIVPGYGMALSQAQQAVATLAQKLKDQGTEVKYAIHPVAGRMPGHMSVLLCEADVDYSELYMMEDINDDFKDADAVIVVGANDVTNPSANTAEGTPIYGMPILNVEDAQNIIICNFDTKPGYAGVDNPLYTSEKTTMLLGDAKETVNKLITDLAQVPQTTEDSENNPVQVLRDAKKVIIVPGYGMALSQAQQAVATLAQKLKDQGSEVKYAIHPVAGRMPGHMSVLLCEADVDYSELYMMEDINDDFKDADVVIVVGANDVTNPSANTAEGTPIYGMPILNVEDAQNIIICNFDTKPGYAGVDNPLYTFEKTTMLLGDAKETVNKLITDLAQAPQTAEKTTEDVVKDPIKVLHDAKKVIVVPGYGMALSQAQQSVANLAQKLKDQGTEVKYAIHPVAGRMPGHMSVLLCEANIDYSELYMMEDINEDFKDVDAVIVVGANDVTNPAANTAEGTPIYGMPILNVEDAPQIIICNFDTKPGYAGVDNPLYTLDKTIMLLGDAKETVDKLIADF